MASVNICTFPVLLHRAGLCLTSVVLRPLPKALIKSPVSESKMSPGRWGFPLGCLIAEPNPARPTLPTARFALVVNAPALALAHGLPNTPVTRSAFLPATAMALSQSRAGQMPCSSKVCRNLFGPVDHHQLQNDFEDLLRQHLEEAQQRWNFNFETETPLEGQFKWERVLLAEQPPQDVHSLAEATSSESRSSLVHKVPSTDRLGTICPKGSQQSSEVYRAGSLQSLKRGQTTIKGECWRLGVTPWVLAGIVGVMALLVGTDGGNRWRGLGCKSPAWLLSMGGTPPSHASLSWRSRALLPRGKGCKLGTFWLLGVRQGACLRLVGLIAEDTPR